MKQYTQRVGVGAIIINREGKILLGIRNVDDNRGKWELLGGLVKNTEPLEDAIKREVMEEAGIKIEPQVTTGTYDRYFEDEGNRNIGFTYLCNHLSGEPHLTEFGRVKGFEWVEPDQVFERELTPYTKLQLEMYFEWKKKTEKYVKDFLALRA